MGGQRSSPAAVSPKSHLPYKLQPRPGAGAWVFLLGLPSPLAVAVQGKKPPVPPLSLPFLPLPLPRLCSLLRAPSLGVGGFQPRNPIDRPS